MSPDATRYVYPFSQHRIVNGVYVDADGREHWPKWTNIKSYEAWKWQQDAKDYGRVTQPA